jgi:Mrp family chromosome partitioning ATPase
MGPTRFATEGLPLLLSAAQDGQYDLVCVDVPPLVHVAYANTITRAVGSSVVVLRHGSRVSEAEEVKNRLALSDSSTLGYVYNMVPLRPDAGGSARPSGESVAQVEPESEFQWQGIGRRSSGRRLNGA